MSPRIDLTPEEIARVVSRFYGKVRAHPMLGAIFAAHVTDWPTHEARIAAFWRNAILQDGSYSGNPLAVHKAAGNVRPGMFVPWLNLFEATLTEELPPAQAEAWKTLAHRIGRGLSWGLQDYGGMPNLKLQN